MGYESINVPQLDRAANWQVTASEKGYLQVRELLRRFASDMNQALALEDAVYRSNMEEELSRHNQLIAQLEEQHLTVPNRRAEQEFQALSSACRSEAADTAQALRAQLDALSVRYRQGSFLEKIAAFVISRQDEALVSQFDNRRNYLNSMELTMNDALNQVHQTGKELYEAKVRHNNRIFQKYKEQAVQEHQLRKENIENEHRNRVGQLVSAYSKEFTRYFNRAAFVTAYDMAATTMRSAVGYTCSDKIPEALYLGVRTFTVSPGEKSFSPEVVNLFRRIEHPAVNAGGQGITVSLPFFRSIREGYSVYLEVKDAAAPAGNKIVWDYVMKTLMNFPAGQTRPLLLDCDSTTELTDFKVIGDSSGRNMITRPWTDAGDIETELKKLSTEHSNLTISYGKDVAARMLREPIYVVACRNFPKGLSADALNSISTIFSAGASRGFFGILQANVRELANLESDPSLITLLDAVKQASLYVRETANGYVIEDSTGKDRFVFERMTAAEQNKSDILSYLIDGVSRYRRQIEKFEYLFSKDAGNISKMDMNNVNTWFLGDASSRLEVPIGISGASTVQKYVIGGVAQHGLISGVTGSGKSTLLKTIIIASMMKYNPDNLNLYLVDFKEGVEFAAFSEYSLPWIKAIALNTQRMFALNILRQLEDEFRRRADAMRRSSVSQIREAGKRFPRILLVFDEIQELLRIDDDITRDCINILSGLVSEGRAMNINVIMASQNFAVCRGMESLTANMVIRVAMKGSPESARFVMGDDFNVSQLEQGDSGSAAINAASGARGNTTFFQVGYLEDEEMKDLLSKLSMAMSSRKADTRIMAIHANQDRNNKFNRLITDGEVDYSEKPSNYELMLGDEFFINRRREISIGAADGENLLLVGEHEPTAKSLFAMSILSALYGELASRAKNPDGELIRLVDMSDEYGEDAEYLHFLASRFGRQINRVTAAEVSALIDDTYRVLTDRKRGLADKSERLFLMIFGLDSIQCLRKEMFSDEDELPLNTKLLRLIQEGPRYGINCILWARSYEGFLEAVDSVMLNKHFTKRIYFGPNEDSAKVLGIRHDMTRVGEKTVAYRDMNRAVPSTFRVYELPHPEWVESIAEACKNFRHRQ